jgi:hypothetical protein
MPLTTYQELIKKHLTDMLSRGEYITSDIIILYSERDFAVDVCAECDYVPVFGYYDGQGWISFRAIQISPC